MGGHNKKKKRRRSSSSGGGGRLGGGGGANDDPPSWHQRFESKKQSEDTTPRPPAVAAGASNAASPGVVEDNSSGRGGEDDIPSKTKPQRPHQQQQQKHSSRRINRLNKKHVEFRKSLPVYRYRTELLHKIRTNDVVLVTADTGSGKSTQVASMIHEGGLLSSFLGQHGGEGGCFETWRNGRKVPLGRTIGITQPRRVAAITVAGRVAEECGCHPGTTVGHRVRFDDCADKNGPFSTKILYVTDGMLLREATSDPLLRRYGIVILDEAHERSLQTDILFGVVRRAMKARRRLPPPDGSNTSTTDDKGVTQSSGHHDVGVDVGENDKEKDEIILQKMKAKARRLNLPPLKVVVMSATLDTETFRRFFPTSDTIHIPGRNFPVQILYTSEMQEDYIDAALSTVLQIHESTEDGDVLVFLPGQEEIEDLASLLRHHLDEEAEVSRNVVTSSSDGNKNKDIVQSLSGMGKNVSSGHNAIINGVLVCVLYAALPPELQLFAFRPKPEGCIRKVILSTNIAETSVTVQGIKFVVDTGKHKQRQFSGVTGMESLSIADVSKAQATQRSGRAGRTASGYCFRLYTEPAYEGLSDMTSPEILRVDLAQIVLQLKGMGVHDPRKFDFLTPPSTDSLVKAFDLLHSLRAIDGDMNLTDHGKRMAMLPLEPTFAHLLLQSPKYECIKEMLSAISMCSAENVFYRPGGNEEGGGSNTMASKAAAAHRRFVSHEGDLPTLLFVYNSWLKEAIYVPRNAGGKKRAETAASRPGGHGKVLHGDWCMRNFISGRALVRAHEIRSQLEELCARPAEKNGLGWDTDVSCGSESMPFLKCTCAGLFLKVASRLPREGADSKKRAKRGGQGPDPWSQVTGRYKTKLSGEIVSVHPTSSMFGRNPAPKCVVFTELLVTKKTYIRGVTQVREDWLPEVAPHYYKPT